MRAAYLTCPPRIADEMRAVTPPWVVSLVGQVAAVEALEDPQYYAQRYAETRHLREELLGELRALGGLQVLDGAANFLLCSLAEGGPDAISVLRGCRRHGLFLRDAAALGASLGRRALRIAVKDRETNRRILAILGGVLRKAC